MHVHSKAAKINRKVIFSRATFQCLKAKLSAKELWKRAQAQLSIVKKGWIFKERLDLEAQRPTRKGILCVLRI